MRLARGRGVAVALLALGLGGSAGAEWLSEADLARVEAEEAARRTSLPLESATTSLHRMTILFRPSDSGESHAETSRAAPAIEATGESRWLARATARAFTVLAQLGDEERALAFGERARTLAEEAGDTFRRGAGLSSLAYFHHRKQEYDRTLDDAKLSRARAIEIAGDDRVYETITRESLARTSRTLGLTGRAPPEAEAALALAAGACRAHARKKRAAETIGRQSAELLTIDRLERDINEEVDLRALIESLLFFVIRDEIATLGDLVLESVDVPAAFDRIDVRPVKTLHEYVISAIQRGRRLRQVERLGDVVALADAALYEANRSGKDRVVAAAA